MRHHKEKLQQGISAILTLNTIAHTVGAAGYGESTDETDLVADLRVLVKQRRAGRLQPFELSKDGKTGEARAASTEKPS